VPFYFINLLPTSLLYISILLSNAQVPAYMNSFGPGSCSLGPRAEKSFKFHSREGAGRKEMGEAIQVVISRAFFLIFPCNHIINIYKKFFFRRSKRERNFPFFFLLHKRAKPILPPYTLSQPTYPPISPPTHPSPIHPILRPPTHFRASGSVE
jgi:hypothetical protein